VLADGKNIAIRILEPRRLVTLRRGPNPELAILSERKPFGWDAALIEPGCGGADIVHFPSKDRALQRGKIRYFCNANHVPAHPHHQRILIQAHKIEAKIALVEGAGLNRSPSWERNQLG
jgi:hypothetical protein